MQRKRTLMKKCLLMFVGAAVCGQLAAGESLSYVDLIKRLTDLERLAVLPAAGESCAQWSSYDRASRFDATTGQYVAWDANGDGDGFIRKEGDRIVMAEMEGPGCIWRMWSAAPKDGHVRIYLDGASEPAVDLPFLGYFDGKNEPFTRSALVHTVAMGWNNYTPVPYQKSCKIVADANWGQYFQFVYTTYPKGTQLPTFTRRLSAAEAGALDEANRTLTACGPTEGNRLTVSDGLLDAGAVETHAMEGPEAIIGIRAKIEDLPESPADREALRALTLEIRWDGEKDPGVWAPFGDFFGTAAGANGYQSLPCGLTEAGVWYANWFMPFARSAEVKVRNEGAQSRRLKLEVVTAPLKSDPSRYARFHAKWHRDAFLPDDPERRKIDWTLLRSEGRGRFLGVMLHVWNPKGSWWGEGDEKFFVDGEKFPSTIGTGSEDYFGYAWCNPTRFQNAFHNQTISMNNKGHICVNRWHIVDNVPFQRSFEGAIEKYFPNRRPTLYASTVYWYLAPGGRDPYPALPLSERVGYWNDVDLQVRKVKGALEGEQLKVLSKTAGKPQEQDMTSYEGDWSGGAHLWWTEAKPGDRLELAVPVTAAATYQITAQLTKAVDYGIVQLSLDGRKLGGPIDLFNNGVIATGPLDLGTQAMSAGGHTLTVEIVGANAAAMKSYMFGLDYLKLDPAP
jgi:hypothetical protein